MFGETFPKSNSNIATLLNEVRIYANSEEEKDVDKLFGELRDNFQIRSAWMSTPISNPKSIETFHEKQVSKLFIINKNNLSTLKLLKKEYNITRDLPIEENYIFAHKDEASRSTIFILNLKNEKDLGAVLTQLKEMEFVNWGKTIFVK